MGLIRDKRRVTGSTRAPFSLDQKDILKEKAKNGSKGRRNKRGTGGRTPRGIRNTRGGSGRKGFEKVSSTLACNTVIVLVLYWCIPPR